VFATGPAGAIVLRCHSLRCVVSVTQPAHSHLLKRPAWRVEEEVIAIGCD